MRSASSIRRSNLPGPRKCSWPANSSIDRGRMRAAKGRARSRFSASWRSNSPKGVSAHREEKNLRRNAVRGERVIEPVNATWEALSRVVLTEAKSAIHAAGTQRGSLVQNCRVNTLVPIRTWQRLLQIQLGLRPYRIRRSHTRQAADFERLPAPTNRATGLGDWQIASRSVRETIHDVRAVNV
jgi:hypothetical protein